MSAGDTPPPDGGGFTTPPAHAGGFTTVNIPDGKAKALGKETVIANATGCMEVISSLYPTTAWTLPWIHVAFPNAAAVGSGVEAGLKVLRRKGMIPDRYIKTVAIGGDGGTVDIGLQALSGAMERGHDLLYICFDNEAYMNTGIQRSSATPFGASTTTAPAGKASMGNKTWKKNVPEIMVAHNISYVATACHSYPIDFMNKVKKARAVKGPAYIHCLSVCPTGWRVDSKDCIKMGRLAVETAREGLHQAPRSFPPSGPAGVGVHPGAREPGIREVDAKGGMFKILDGAGQAGIAENLEG